MWRDYLKKLLSRKFQLALAGVIGYILLAVAGAVDWPTALNAISKIIMVYIGVEGAGDALGRIR